MKRFITLTLVGALFLTLIEAHPTRAAETGKYVLVKVEKSEGKTWKDDGASGSESISENSYQYDDRRLYPNGSFNREVHCRFTLNRTPPRELKPGETFTMKLAGSVMVTGDRSYVHLKGSCTASSTKIILTLKPANSLEGYIPDVVVGNLTSGWVDSAAQEYAFRAPDGPEPRGSRRINETRVLRDTFEISWSVGDMSCSFHYKWQGGPSDPEETPPTQGKIQLLDANPMFTPGLKLPLSSLPTAQEDRALLAPATEESVRLGAAADGVSLLLVRASFPVKGTVTFTLEGAGEQGTLHPLIGNPWRPGPHQPTYTTPTRKVAPAGGATEEYAFALYKPPSSAWRGTGARKVTLKAVLKPAGKGAEVRADRLITLARPPVVLVHGTYDEPINCWKTKKGSIEFQQTIVERLNHEGFQEGSQLFLVDWEATNGSSNPSDFVTNQQTVFYNKNGIKDALTSFRKRGYAATQADLVCHSQGGVIARVYIKGINLYKPRAKTDPHYTAPEKCQQCWYHNPQDHHNFHRGDIRRLITISSTHRGSDLCRLLMAYNHHYVKSNLVLGARIPHGAALWTGLLLDVAHYQQGVWTGGFRDQTPGSAALRAIGATPVRAHAIACVADDGDLAKIDDGYYLNRMGLIWDFSDEDTLKESFEYISQSEDARLLTQGKIREKELASEMRSFSPSAAAQAGANHKFVRQNNLSRLRAAAFGHERNDCTVSEASSLGGLKPPYATTIPNVLHGYASRYKSVQERVVALLTGDDNQFAPGFPDTYEFDPARAVSGVGSSTQPAVGDHPTGPATRMQSRVSQPKTSEQTVLPNTKSSRPSAQAVKPGTTGGGSVSGAANRTMSKVLDFESGKFSPNDWEMTSNGGGSVTIERDDLNFTVPANKTGGGEAWSRGVLRGDFNLIFACALEDWEGSEGDELSLDVRIASAPRADAPSAVVVSRRIAPDGSGTFFLKSSSSEKSARVTRTSRRRWTLRVERKGSEWILWRFESQTGDWEKLGQVTQELPQDVYLGFITRKSGQSGVMLLVPMLQVLPDK